MTQSLKEFTDTTLEMTRHAKELGAKSQLLVERLRKNVYATKAERIEAKRELDLLYAERAKLDKRSRELDRRLATMPVPAMFLGGFHFDVPRQAE